MFSDHTYCAKDDFQLPLLNSVPLYSFDCSREGLSYIAGFLAFKMSNDFPELGFKISDLPRIPKLLQFPWLSSLSQSGLTQPTTEFFKLVENLEKLFREYHGISISTETDVFNNFVKFALNHIPDLHPKIALRFAKLRTFIRIKYLNHQLKEEKNKITRRHLNKVGHFL